MSWGKSKKMYNRTKKLPNFRRHNLGAQHDGTDADGSNGGRNTCDGAAYYVMAAVGGTVTGDDQYLNPYKFSPCSAHYFEEVLARCVFLEGRSLRVFFRAEKNVLLYFMRTAFSAPRLAASIKYLYR